MPGVWPRRLITTWTHTYHFHNSASRFSDIRGAAHKICLPNVLLIFLLLIEKKHQQQKKVIIYILSFLSITHSGKVKLQINPIVTVNVGIVCLYKPQIMKLFFTFQLSILCLNNTLFKVWAGVGTLRKILCFSFRYFVFVATNTSGQCPNISLKNTQISAGKCFDISLKISAYVMPQTWLEMTRRLIKIPNFAGAKCGLLK